MACFVLVLFRYRMGMFNAPRRATIKTQYISKKTFCASNEADSGVSSFAPRRISRWQRDGLVLEMYCHKGNKSRSTALAPTDVDGLSLRVVQIGHPLWVPLIMPDKTKRVSMFGYTDKR